MVNKNLISIMQLKRGGIEQYIGLANQFSRRRLTNIHTRNPVIILLFFEESTRTRAGFTAAAYSLRGDAIYINETKFHERMGASESLEDTIQSIQHYCDLICLRHPDKDVFSKLHSIVEKPIINCGNGDDEHPTQALIDLMTIKNELGRLDDVSVAIVGNPRYSRSAHSLVLAFSQFEGIKIRTISPPELKLPKQYKKPYVASKNKLEETDALNLENIDVVYVTGFPHKLPNKLFSKAIQEKYSITFNVASQLSKKTIIMCPLPRIDEIKKEVDNLPQARYFTQSKNGLYMRMAVLFKSLEDA